MKTCGRKRKVIEFNKVLEYVQSGIPIRKAIKLYGVSSQTFYHNITSEQKIILHSIKATSVTSPTPNWGVRNYKDIDEYFSDNEDY